MKTVFTPRSSSDPKNERITLIVRLIFIFLLAFFSGTSLFSQTSLTSHNSTQILVPIIHHEHNTKRATIPVKPKKYSVFVAKNFPSLICEKAPVLKAMDDSEEIDYSQLGSNHANVKKEENELQLVAANK